MRIKVSLLILLGTLLSLAASAHNTAAQLNDEELNDGFAPLCGQDIYFHTPVELSTPALKEMADVCNVFAIMHCAYSDYESWVRMDIDGTREALWAVRYSAIANPELRAATAHYVQGLCALIDTTQTEEQHFESFNEAITLYDELDSLICTDYNLDHFGQLSEDEYWQAYDKSNVLIDIADIEERYGTDDNFTYQNLQNRFKNARSIDEKCVLAIAMAHVTDSIDDEGQSIAIAPLRECLESDQYSIYLLEAWRTWRTLIQYSQGASRDSEIYNAFYNKMRMRCLNATFKQIAEHNDDMPAINIFLMLNAVDNICRYGPYPFGNQNMVEYYEMFPEKFSDMMGDDGSESDNVP